MQTTILTYRDMRKIFSKDEIMDLVMYKIVKPIEQTNYCQSWKFHAHEISPELHQKIIDRRSKDIAKHYDDLLANEIEHEWKF